MVRALNRNAKRDASIYRKAARRSLERGDGLDIVVRNLKLDTAWWKYALGCPIEVAPVEREEFCMALLMLAAIAETGDL